MPHTTPSSAAASAASCYATPGLISIDDAIDFIARTTVPLAAESVAIAQACLRVLAEDVYANVDLPPFNQSYVDGYAVCAATGAAAGSEFVVVGEVRTGQVSDIHLQPNEALRIFTGGAIPAGATLVARQEVVVREGDGIRLTQAVALACDIRVAGEECRTGQLLAKAGHCLHAGTVAALAMAGVNSVSVVRQPRIAVLISGDEVAASAAAAPELMGAPELIAAGKIHDANGPLLAAWFLQQGLACDIVYVEDNLACVSAKIAELKANYHGIISTGGVSVGDYDFIREAARATGFNQVFWRVKQKPGKPLFFACDNHNLNTAGAVQPCYLLGLPGNPGAVYVSMQLYGKQLLNSLLGANTPPLWLPVRLQAPLAAMSVERLLRMECSLVQGELQVANPGNQQSHMLSNLFHSNCLVRIPAGQSLPAGAQVLALLNSV